MNLIDKKMKYLMLKKNNIKQKSILSLTCNNCSDKNRKLFELD